MNPVISFGKWKGSPVREVTVRDPKYARWLAANTFFRERYPDAYRVVRDAVIEELLAEMETEQAAGHDLV